MLTQAKIDAIVHRADYMANLEAQRGYHHAMGNLGRVKLLEKQVEVARKQLKNLLKNLK